MLCFLHASVHKQSVPTQQDRVMTSLPHTLHKTFRNALMACGLSLLMAGAVQAQSDSNIVIVGKDGWLYAAWASLSDTDSQAIDASSKLIKEAQTRLAARGVHLELLLLPDKVVLYEEHLPQGKTVSASVKKRYDTILASLRAAGVEVLDTKKLFTKLRHEGKDVYYRSDQHWTLPAAETVAAAIASRIRQAVPKIKGADGSGMPLGKEIRERRYGDLADLFLPQEQRTAIGRETFVVRMSNDAMPLLDDAKAPVHVTGHSMVQAYFGFPQKLSNSVDRPVSLNWKSGNVGPWMVLLEYLESEDFHRNPPQALVWQMYEPVFGFGPQAGGHWNTASLMTPQQWQSRLQKAVGQ